MNNICKILVYNHLYFCGIAKIRNDKRNNIITIEKSILGKQINIKFLTKVLLFKDRKNIFSKLLVSFTFLLKNLIYIF